MASTTADQPAGETGEDPAVATGQEASEVKGAQEQSLPLGGIDAEALPEVPEAPVVPEAPEVPEVSEAPVTEQPEQTQQPEPSAEAPATEQPEQTLQPEPTDGTGVDEAPADENGAAATDEAEAELMSATLPESGAAVPAPESVDSGTRPSDVVLQDLQVKARSAPAPLEAAVAEEAEALTDSVMDKALSTTQDLEVEKIATLTQPVETMNFIVAGVTWDIEDAGQVTDVSLRVRESSGWTDWNSMEIHAGDEKPNADRVGTEPLISSGADAIQVRLTTVDGESPAGLELDLIDPGTADTDGKLEPASPASPALQQLEGQAGLSAPEAAAASTNSATHNSATASAEFVPAVHPQQGPITGTAQAQTVATNYDNVLKPAIITRAQWGADESLTSDWGRTSTDLKAMYVHHTAGSNNYSASGAYAQIRGIYQYHAVTLDWQDIGYQFLVDKYGKIYQGRRGSIDAPVQGAQAGGFNTDTIGVSAMGNYDVASAPAAMVRAIERVLAWQAYRYDVDPTAQVTLTQSGKGTARWTSGTRTTQNTILGHRDTNLTACPGRYLYAQLPTIRRNVDSSVTSAIRSYGKYQQVQAPPQVVPARQAWTDGKLSIWWNKAPRTDYYKVFRRTAPVGSSSFGRWYYVGQVDGRYSSGSYAVSAGTTTQFAVRAFNDGGHSPLVTVATHTRETVQAPPQVVPARQAWTDGKLS
ncbi:MAG: N-acetylmuramoyl-L-alanine amidase, partial [Citricoccus sp.]